MAYDGIEDDYSRFDNLLDEKQSSIAGESQDREDHLGEFRRLMNRHIEPAMQAAAKSSQGQRFQMRVEYDRTHRTALVVSVGGFSTTLAYETDPHRRLTYRSVTGWNGEQADFAELELDEITAKSVRGDLRRFIGALTPPPRLLA